MPSMNEQKHQQYYRAVTANSASAGDDLVVLELEQEGQVSRLNIFGPDAQGFHVETRDYDTDTGDVIPGTEEVKFKLAGNSNYNVGNFDEPLFEFGAVKEVAVVADTNLSADDYGINIRVDELTG